MKDRDCTESGLEGASIAVSGLSWLRSSVALPTDWPRQRIVMGPPRLGRTRRMDVMDGGALGAQACHAANSAAALARDNVQLTPNTTAVASGNTEIVNRVAIPKLPPPPPRKAQYRSGSE